VGGLLSQFLARPFLDNHTFKTGIRAVGLNNRLTWVEEENIVTMLDMDLTPLEERK